jgi:hypothetical protein
MVEMTENICLAARLQTCYLAGVQTQLLYKFLVVSCSQLGLTRFGKSALLDLQRSYLAVSCHFVPPAGLSYAGLLDLSRSNHVTWSWAGYSHPTCFVQILGILRDHMCFDILLPGSQG